jgi:phosphotransferase system IIB component
MTTAPYDESVHEAVAREAARRKRVFLAFLGLLLIPIAIGAYALSKAPTEIEKVASDVTPIVTSRVSGEISERVTKDVSARTEPLIRENVAREITAVTNDITQLRTTVQKTSELVQNVTPRLDAMSGFVSQTENTLKVLNTNQGRLDQELKTIRAPGISIRPPVTDRELMLLRRELESLQARVKALESARDRQVPR